MPLMESMVITGVEYSKLTSMTNFIIMLPPLGVALVVSISDMVG